MTRGWIWWREESVADGTKTSWRGTRPARSGSWPGPKRGSAGALDATARPRDRATWRCRSARRRTWRCRSEGGSCRDTASSCPWVRGQPRVGCRVLCVCARTPRLQGWGGALGSGSRAVTSSVAADRLAAWTWSASQRPHRNAWDWGTLLALEQGTLKPRPTPMPLPRACVVGPSGRRAGGNGDPQLPKVPHPDEHAAGAAWRGRDGVRRRVHA